MATKFSQFNVGNAPVAGDQFVGLRAGLNTIFTFPGAGGGVVGLSRQINQGAHGFVVGDVLRLNGAVYDLAQADAAIHADVVGIVIAVVDAANFIIQFGGYVVGLAALVAGTTYFLSAAAPGQMTAVAPVAAGQIRKPLFIADSATTGYWLNYNGQQL